MVGEPVAYATGPPGLKAIGPSRTVANSPITRGQRGLFAGAHRRPYLLRLEPVAARGLSKQYFDLERRTISARDAYREALLAWEEADHRCTCIVCRGTAVSRAEQQVMTRAAEVEKERLRVLFRDLCDELGSIPSGAENTPEPPRKPRFCETAIH